MPRSQRLTLRGVVPMRSATSSCDQPRISRAWCRRALRTGAAVFILGMIALLSLFVGEACSVGFECFVSTHGYLQAIIVQELTELLLNGLMVLLPLRLEGYSLRQVMHAQRCTISDPSLYLFSSLISPALHNPPG